MKIIVVEDNCRARTAIAACLSPQAGLQITAQASNGLEAIRKITDCPPDLVIMDVQMPVMNGIEATKLIKTNWPQIKIIVLTMYADYRSEALAAGADAFLVKDCPVHEIISVIRALRNQSSG